MDSNIQNISIIDFNKICRICMSEGNLVDIFSKCETEDCIFEMLASCTLTMASEKDELPDKICLQCLSELKLAYKFYQKSEVTDNLLHKLLEKSKKADQVNRSPCKKIKNQSNRTQTVIENTEIDISAIKKDINFKLDTAFKNNSDNDHNYIMHEKVCEKENTTPNETVLNCNQNNTDTDQTTNASKIKNRCSYECKKCSMTGFTYHQLRVHWMTVHGAKYGERQCEVCDKFFGLKQFKQHIQSHPQYRPFACDLCDAKFRFKSHLERHKNSHLTVKSYSCDQCVKIYTRLENLHKHIVKHHASSANDDLSANKSSSSTEGHLCHVCDRCFPSKASLNQHVLIHGDKKYLCWFCGKSFSTGGGLLSHVKIHTGIKPYRCSYCPKSFIYSSALKQHVFTHTGEKPYICEFCSKSFAQIHHLKYHLPMHTGVKPHKCSLCAKCYASPSTLKEHMRTHTGVTPYVCEVCGKGFYHSSHMRRHMKIHAKTQNTCDN